MVKATRILTVGVSVIAMFAALVQALATPEPSPTPVSWELQFKPTVPERINLSSRHGSGPLWYVLYTVTNNTDEDVPFHPEIVRVEEIESEVPADRARQNPQEAAKITVTPAIVGLERSVFEAIKKRHAATHPFLVHPVDAIGTLKQGDDYAGSSVAVFRDLEARVKKFTIYVGGLSGEQIVRPNPMYDPKKSEDDSENPRVFVLRKTLAMPYVLPGDVKTRRTAQPRLGQMEWVMR